MVENAVDKTEVEIRHDEGWTVTRLGRGRLSYSEATRDRGKVAI